MLINASVPTKHLIGATHLLKSLPDSSVGNLNSSKAELTVHETQKITAFYIDPGPILFQYFGYNWSEILDAA